MIDSFDIISLQCTKLYCTAETAHIDDVRGRIKGAL